MTHASKNDPIERAERAGRKGDRLLGHLTPGDVVIPKGKVTPELREFLAQHFDVERYTAGHEKNSVNPKTGLPEFFDIGASFDGPSGLDMGSGLGIGLGAAAQGAVEGVNGAMGMGLGVDGSGLAGAAPTMDPGVTAAPQGFWDAVRGFFASGVGPAPVGDSHFNTANATVDSAQGVGANGGLLDSTMPSWVKADAGINPYPWLYPQNQVAAPVVPNNVNPLVAPTAPNVPQTAPDIGRYYGALVNKDIELANNLLGPYLSGNKNVYGR